MPSGRRRRRAKRSRFGLVLAGRLGDDARPAANWLAAALLAFTIFFYVVVYTMWLKRSTPQNIVIGGAAGALPAGDRLGGGHRRRRARKPHPVPDHLPVDAAAFLGARALQARATTRAAGIPMMPIVAGEPRPGGRSSLYSVLLAPVGRAAGAHRHRRTALRRRGARSSAPSSSGWRVRGRPRCARRRPRWRRRGGSSPFRCSISSLLFAMLLAEAGLGVARPCR